MSLGVKLQLSILGLQLINTVCILYLVMAVAHCEPLQLSGQGWDHWNLRANINQSDKWMEETPSNGHVPEHRIDGAIPLIHIVDTSDTLGQLDTGLATPLDGDTPVRLVVQGYDDTATGDDLGCC